MKEYALENLIEKYAVKNAIEHNGNCNSKAVLGKIISENNKLKSQLKEIIPKINKICEQINSLKLEDQQKLMEKYTYKEKKIQEKSLKELKNTKRGKVVMRFAPFPSGPLHIGNSRPAILNDEYVKKYNGKFILVIDDTIGSKSKVPILDAYELIIDGLKWLGIKIDKIVYKSDRMNLFYKYAEEFLKNGWAYVCTCPTEKLREYRKKGIECKHRKQTSEVNLKEWKKMISGKYKEGEASVRLKTNMKDRDPAFRDRVLLRISDTLHPKVKDKFKVWPMLEFSWAIDDHELGITHILRGKDLAMEEKMERFMWKLLGWKAPEILMSGMLQLEGAKISKSKAQKEVKNGEYIGWYDPRTWSLQSLKKRGFKPEAIRKFVLAIGLTKTDSKVPIENLYRENRIIIEPQSNRYFFVSEPVEIKVENVPREFVAKILKHPDYLEKGIRKITVSPKNNLKKKIPIVHWLPKDQTIPCKVFMPDGKIFKGFCENNILEVKENEVIQYERFGFVRVDKIGKIISCFYTHS